MLSGRGLCDELITRSEESYRLCCVVVCDLETLRMGAPYIYDISRLRVKQTLLELPSVHSLCDHSLQFTLRKAVGLAVIIKILMSRNNEPILSLNNRNRGRY